jgi:hypothetical protein
VKTPLLLNQVSLKAYPLVGFQNKTIAVKWVNQTTEKWYFYNVKHVDHGLGLALFKPFSDKKPYWVSVQEIESVARVKDLQL